MPGHSGTEMLRDQEHGKEHGKGELKLEPPGYICPKIRFYADCCHLCEHICKARLPMARVGGLTSLPSLLHKLQGAALNHGMEDVKVAGVWAFHLCVHQAAGVPGPQADPYLTRASRMCSTAFTKVLGPCYILQKPKKGSLWFGRLRMPCSPAERG